jgi:hypothetical protein
MSLKKLDEWEAAMRSVRQAEARLEGARVRFGPVNALRAEVKALRTCADLLLADAVAAMHTTGAEL